ncbi:MAG: hypothetical protein ACFFFG_04560 [Candidatus Thorarchaeota archaeon]
MVSAGSRPIYFLLSLHGLTILDVKFSSFAPKTDSVLLGGLVHAISTFSDTITDNISSETGTLNVIEREGKKIMFERGQEVEAILVADQESMILMEKIRSIIDIFEENYLDRLRKSPHIVHEDYIDFMNITQKYFLAVLDENVIFKSTKQPHALGSKLRIPNKWVQLSEFYNGKKSVNEVTREIRWPKPYVLTRTAMFQLLGTIKPVDISIRDTDLFIIDEAYLSGILLEQGTAYQTIKKTWDEWGVRLTQSLDGRNTISTLATRFGDTLEHERRVPHFLRWLSLQGYISPLSDSDLIIIIFEGFLNNFHRRIHAAVGDMVCYDIFEAIFKQDASQARSKGRTLSVAKLVDYDVVSFHFEKLQSIMKGRSEIITPLFQQAFLTFLDNIIRIISKVLGKKSALQLIQLSILETEKKYGPLIYDLLFTA